ncbi:hypothetical protein GDO78_016861 [Eleutherodactylus coqui]|uniref:Uncharacterized protein n=1 Tax=Eleutherodactylus coqui TaxID=57060 RepID=A0A8J6JVV9_ELECQ|nr:hypothetical protein GDO78_016861 [Eleutherodactylus coqui]
MASMGVGNANPEDCSIRRSVAIQSQSGDISLMFLFSLLLGEWRPLGSICPTSAASVIDGAPGLLQAVVLRYECISLIVIDGGMTVTAFTLNC